MVGERRLGRGGIAVVGVSRRRLLGWGGGALAALPLLARRGWAQDTERCFVIYWNGGGWDPAMVFDPHFESGLLERGSQVEQATAAGGGLVYAHSPRRPAVKAFFDAWGAQAAVVNGIAVGSISHAQCSRLLLTGSRQSDAADLGTTLAARTGSTLALPHLVVSGPRYPGALGAALAPLSPALTAPLLDTPDHADAVQAYLADAGAALGADDPLVADYLASLARQERLTAVADQIGISDEDDEDTRMARGVSALSLGLCRCLTLASVNPPFASWDSHIDNDRQQNDCYEENFGRLGQLLGLLEDADLMDRTTVLVLSEMGRTPVTNGGGGKDHWPYTSALLIGAGVRGGQTYGATDEALVGQAVDPADGQASSGGALLTAAGFLAGVLASAGVDPAEVLPDATPFLAPWKG